MATNAHWNIDGKVGNKTEFKHKFMNFQAKNNYNTSGLNSTKNQKIFKH